MTSESDEERIADLLEQWEALSESGANIEAEEVIQGEDHLLPELRRRIEALRAMAWIDKPIHQVDDRRMPDEFGVPTKLGRYELQELLGSGGFGQVWKSFDPELQRHVAVKIPHPDRFGSSDEAARFIDEARRVAKLSHSGIVPVYDVGRQGELVYIVSELVEGSNLRDRLNQGPLSEAETRQIVGDISAALGHAHSRGFTHQDVKPANILIDHDGKARLTDFGIEPANAEHPYGTLAYMPPEQLDGRGVDARSDIYSLGMVLYQLLALQLPFGASSPKDVRQAIENGLGEIPFPSNIPKHLQQVCHRCLQVDPDDRYQSTAELLDALTETTGAGYSGVRLFIAAGLIMVAFALLAWRSDWIFQTPNQAARETESGENESNPDSTALIDVPELDVGQTLVTSDSAFTTFVLSHDSMRIATIDQDDRASLWDLRDHQKQFSIIQSDHVSSLSLCKNRSRLASGGTNGTVRLWRFTGEEPKELAAFPGKTSVTSIAFRDDGKFLVAGGIGGDIRLWKLGNPPRLANLPQTDDPVATVAFVGDESRLAIGVGSDYGQPGQIWYWRIEDEAGALNLHPVCKVNLTEISGVSSMAFSSDGNTVISSDSENRVAAWRLVSDSQDDRIDANFLGKFQGHKSEVTKIAISADGARASSISDDGQMYVWSIPDFIPIGKASGVVDVAINQSGDFVTANRKGEIQVQTLP